MWRRHVGIDSAKLTLHTPSAGNCHEVAEGPQMAVKVEQYSDPGVVKGVERSGSVLQITSREPSAVVEASADLILSPVGKNHLGAPSVPDSVAMTQTRKE